MKKMFIISGLQIDKGQWNTDFDMFARRDNLGKIFATDKARKYSIRQELLANGENVLIRKHKTAANEYMSLSNILKSKGATLNKKNISTEMTEIFNSHIDLRLFGFIINPSGFNFSEKGAVQFQYANDIKNNYTEEIISDIISYKTSGEKDEAMTTIGKQNVIDIGFLNYTITVEPNSYVSSFRNYNKGTSDDTIENNFNTDVSAFKEALNTDVTNLNSCAKAGVSNLYNLIITMKNSNSSLDKGLLGSVIVEKTEDNVINIDFSNSIEAIKEVKENIDNIEIVYSKGMEKAGLLKLNDFIQKIEEIGISITSKDLFD
jgi:Cas7 group CRISPR-associated protein Csh2